jgi:hypothetical protein
MTRHIGFYWTLPVPWAGFTSLLQDPAAAAKASRTIAYQRERIRRWVKGEGGTLVHEEVFLELAPDRGSELLVQTVERLLQRCRKDDATLVLVEFWDAYGWRRHGPLAELLDENADACILLDPTPLTSAAGHFDPAQHFRSWREVEGARAAGKEERRAQLAQVIVERQDSHATFKDLAQVLNGDGLTTPTGKPWSADNLRKFLKGL